MIKVHPLALVFLVVCFASLAARSEGQEDDRAEKKTSALLRAWIFPVGVARPLSVSVKASGTKSPKSLSSSDSGAAEPSRAYQQIPAGGARIDLKSGDEVLASTMAGLRKEAHYTVLAWNSYGHWELEIFSDDLPSADVPERPLRVLNFAQGRDATIALNHGEEIPMAKDSVKELELPGQTTLVTTRVKSLDGGPPAKSSIEIDFSAVPSAYVVIVPDYRGRMRPRVISGGQPLGLEDRAPDDGSGQP